MYTANTYSWKTLINNFLYLVHEENCTLEKYNIVYSTSDNKQYTKLGKIVLYSTCEEVVTKKINKALCLATIFNIRGSNMNCVF